MAEETEVYSPLVAGKDSAWLIGKLGASTAAIPTVVATLSALGVTLDTNGVVYKALPYIIFVSLHLAHDWASVKTKLKWI